MGGWRDLGQPKHQRREREREHLPGGGRAVTGQVQGSERRFAEVELGKVVGSQSFREEEFARQGAMVGRAMLARRCDGRYR